MSNYKEHQGEAFRMYAGLSQEEKFELYDKIAEIEHGLELLLSFDYVNEGYRVIMQRVRSLLNSRDATDKEIVDAMRKLFTK